MVAGVIFIVIGVITDVAVLISILLVIRLLIIWLETTLSLVLSLGAEACLSLAHLIELGIVLVVSIILEDLILLVLEVLVLQLLDDLLLLGAALAILQVVHVQLVLQVVNVSVLLHIRAIESFKLSLEALVLLLELRLDVFYSLETLVSALKLNTTPLDGVLQNSLVTSERLDCLLHLLHLAGLRVDDIANALFNVLLLRVLVQVATDGVQELEGLVTGGAHLSFSAKHIVQFGTTFSDLSSKLACGL